MRHVWPPLPVSYVSLYVSFSARISPSFHAFHNKLRSASLDGDGKGIVTRPEGDDGVAGGGLGDAVRLGGRPWVDGVTRPLSCVLFRGGI